ncbi:MAG: AIPR family protein [Oscillospiraceae bacterium]|jgi:hypothetical protein|nr:AIPR family protein [Oscillospiraceae bacterium]
MAKSLSNNQLLLKEYIKREFPISDFSDESTFFDFFTASQVLKESGISDDEVEKGLIGGGNDGGCDAVYMFFNEILIYEDMVEMINIPREASLEVIMIQSKNEHSFGEDALMKWKTTSDNLLKFDNDLSEFKSRYKAELTSFFQTFKDLRIKLLRSRLRLEFKYYYVSLADNEVHPNVQSQADELEAMILDLFPGTSTTVSVEFINADNLMEYMNTQSDNRLNLTLSETPISIGSRKDYVSLVSLKNFYRFIIDENDDLRKYIFEANVRDYQGLNTVNTDISNTLSNETAEDFWWLNNGVTILASEASQVTGKELLIVDPEIVNGLQTSTEIFKYFKSSPNALETETRNILVRVIVPEDESSRDNIILATNRQTSIPQSAFRSTDSIHRQIEMYFKSRGLYYDRRKNYYRNQGKKPNEIISITFLGQCLMSLFLKKPNYARARPSTLLSDDDEYNIIFKKDGDLEVFYRVAILGKKVEQVIKSTEHSSSEKGDILFYTLYFVLGTYFESSTILPENIKSMKLTEINDKLIYDAEKIVYNEYVDLGGTGIVAKGSDLINRLINLLK